MKPRILTLYNELIKELECLGWEDCGGMWRHPEGGIYHFDRAFSLARTQALREEELKQKK